MNWSASSSNLRDRSTVCSIEELMLAGNPGLKPDIRQDLLLHLVSCRITSSSGGKCDAHNLGIDDSTAVKIRT